VAKVAEEPSMTEATAIMNNSDRNGEKTTRRFPVAMNSICAFSTLIISSILQRQRQQRQYLIDRLQLNIRQSLRLWCAEEN
jgi:hypothetical protein